MQHNRFFQRIVVITLINKLNLDKDLMVLIQISQWASTANG